MSCIQKVKSQTGNKPQVEGRQKEIREGRGLQKSCQMRRNPDWQLRGRDVGVTERTWDDAWGIDCVPVALSAAQKLWALQSLLTLLKGSLNTACLPGKFTLENSGPFESRECCLLVCLFVFHLRVNNAFPLP